MKRVDIGERVAR